MVPPLYLSARNVDILILCGGRERTAAPGTVALALGPRDRAISRCCNGYVPLRLRPWDARTGTAAASRGDREMLVWLISQQYTLNWPIYDAGSSGDIFLLQWLIENDIRYFKNINRAAEKGMLHIIRWYEEHFPTRLSRRTAWFAARGGQLDVLKWLKEQRCALDEVVCSSAAKIGRLDILQWLRSQNPPCPWDEKTSDMAALGGHAELLRWAIEQGCPCTTRSCAEAALGGHLPLLQWLRSQNPPCPWDEKTSDMAALGGHTEVLRWARDNGCPWDEETSASAAVRGDFKLLMWVVENGCPLTGKACIEAARQGNLKVLQWCVKKGAIVPIKECVDAATKSGHLHILKWLLAEKQIDLSFLDTAAKFGFFHILQWGFAEGGKWSEKAVSAAAIKGRPDIVCWLLARTPPVDAKVCSMVARSANLSAVKLLREKGCPWDERVRVGRILLMLVTNESYLRNRKQRWIARAESVRP